MYICIRISLNNYGKEICAYYEVVCACELVSQHYESKAGNRAGAIMAVLQGPETAGA